LNPNINEPASGLLLKTPRFDVVSVPLARGQDGPAHAITPDSESRTTMTPDSESRATMIPDSESRTTNRVVDGPTRAIIRHPGAVVILPLVDANHVCLIRNFRIAIDRTLVELPAGTLEPPEPPLAAARRELAEETGFRAEQFRQLHAFYPSPGILDERMVLVLATGLTPGAPARQPDEAIQNTIVDWDTALTMVDDQTIQDAKTIIGLLYYERIRRRD
jgi:ADP-ribose pyrophosphatase